MNSPHYNTKIAIIEHLYKNKITKTATKTAIIHKTISYRHLAITQ